jgi:hypothetical protein
MPLILEGIVSTCNADGRIHVAPMGPIVDEAITRLALRPFRTSTTYANLVRTRCGVFHVVDDVLLLARAAIGRLDETPSTFPAQAVAGAVLADACRWYEFRVTSVDDTHERSEMETEVVHAGRLHDFFGFNRARHAVLEAAILATRLHLLPREDVRSQLDALRVIVHKTAGPRECEAFELLARHVAESPPDGPAAS